jgi:hypothetical protein
LAWNVVAVDRGAIDWLFSEVNISDLVHKRLHGVYDHTWFGIGAFNIV